MENGSGGGGEAVPNGGGAKNGKAVQAFERCSGQVQGILEHNRVLIQEIKQNQESGEDSDLNRNVALIRELNSNIARIGSLYSDLSAAFAKGTPAARAADAAKGYNKRSRPPQ
ncbi:protein ELF4-LIKE 3-like [Lolium perenne]|jgi:hypothetical protein|uniref:protein ELF4-LIKE 3-like n=1 Tax=Lolium perenne TaxID=4522 RepID=UPI0021EB2B0B|nr:protein ELF4-LIKE 3-like [Lolium perenne]